MAAWAIKLAFIIVKFGAQNIAQKIERAILIFVDQNLFRSFEACARLQFDITPAGILAAQPFN